MISPKWAKGISPAPRPSEGQGKPLEGGGLVPPFLGFCRLTLSARGSQEPSDAQRPGPFVWGGGVLSAPSGPFSHARLFVPAPGLLFFFPRPSRPAYELESWMPMDNGSLHSENGRSNSESCPLTPGNFPRAPRTRRPPQPLAFVGSYLCRRGKCCAFFAARLSGDFPSLFFFAFFSEFYPS